MLILSSAMLGYSIRGIINNANKEGEDHLNAMVLNAIAAMMWAFIVVYSV